MTHHLRTRSLETPLGTMTAASVAGGLGDAPEPAVVCLEFGHRAERGLGEAARWLGLPPEHDTVGAGGCPALDRLEAELSAYFAGEGRGFDVPILLLGTPFQRRVWSALLEIPFGETMTYGQLAERVGSPGGARAVGRANGSNRIAVLVPCHRVIDASGELHGYGGGLDNKRRLLELEGAFDAAPLFAGGLGSASE